MRDYNRPIHSNPNALAWAKFFVETQKKVAPELLELYSGNHIEEVMIGWFSNAMMAMSDHIHNTKIRDYNQVCKLNEQLMELLSLSAGALEFYSHGYEGNRDVVRNGYGTEEEINHYLNDDGKRAKFILDKYSELIMTLVCKTT